MGPDAAQAESKGTNARRKQQTHEMREVSVQPGTCLVRMSKDALLIANTGRPITNEGLESLCAAHLSSKTERRYELAKPGCCGDSHVEAIQRRTVDEYCNNPLRLLEDAEGERQLARDYGGRTLWEAFQNAEDSMGDGPGAIGRLGVGTKSFIEVSGEPEFYSDELAFKFSEPRTRHLLQEEIRRGRLELPESELPSLVFRIPHPMEVAEEIGHLLRNGFSTVVRLPYRSGVRVDVIEMANDVSPVMMVFLTNMSKLLIESADGSSRMLEVVLREQATAGRNRVVVRETTIGSSEGESKTHDHVFWQWCDELTDDAGHLLTASIVLPETDGNVAAAPAPQRFHVFFPTEVVLPVYAWVHGTFDVSGDRSRPINWKESPVWPLFERVIASILDDPDVGLSTSLDTFGVTTVGGQGEFESYFTERLLRLVRTHAFVPTIGGNRCAPEQVRIWQHELGAALDPNNSEVERRHLVDVDVAETDRRVLASLGAQWLPDDECAKLLVFSVTNSLEQCQRVAKVVEGLLSGEQTAVLEIASLLEIPFIWCADDRSRALRGNTPLFVNEAPVPKTLDNWIDHDLVHTDFVDHIKAITSKLRWVSVQGKRFGRISAVVTPYLLAGTEKMVLQHCLVPLLQKASTDGGWWVDSGWDFLAALEALVVPICAAEKEPSRTPWGSEVRESLMTNARFPTNRGWLKAVFCYAGKDWGGPRSFDDYFGDVPDRGLIIPPSEWHEQTGADGDPDGWRKLMQYCGVSWEPKLVASREGHGLGATGEFGSMLGWSTYCDSEKFRGCRMFVKQWAIEHFPDSLAGDPDAILSCLKRLVPETHRNRDGIIRHCDGRRTDKHIESFAWWQVTQLEWLPSKPALLHKRRTVSPTRAYIPGSGLAGVLPELLLSIPPGRPGIRVRSSLNLLGIKEGLPPFYGPEWALMAHQAHQASESQEDYVHLQGLYRKILTLPGCPPGLPLESDPVLCDRVAETVESPAVDGTKDSGAEKSLGLLDRDNVYWVDEPYLDHPQVRSALLQVAKVGLFPFSLTRGRKATECFGIQPLSSQVQVTPLHDTAPDGTDQKFVTRLIEREAALRALAGVGGHELPSLGTVRLVAATRLRLRIQFGEVTLGEVPIDSWGDGDQFIVASEDRRSWIGLGEVVETLSHKKIAADTAENVLRARGQEVIDRLRKNGVSNDFLLQIQEGLETCAGPSKLESPPIEEDGDQSGAGAPTEETVESETLRQTSIDQASTQIRFVPSAPPEGDTSGHSPGKPAQISPPGQGTGAQLVRTTSIPPNDDTFYDEAKHPDATDPPGAGRTDRGRVLGLKAEDRLRGCLRAVVEPLNWSVSSGPEKVTGVEADIVLSKGTKRIPIECKRANGGSFYWSSRQCELAHDRGSEYLLALVYDQADSIDVVWVRDPGRTLEPLWKDGSVKKITRFEISEDVDPSSAPWKGTAARTDSHAHHSKPRVSFAVPISVARSLGSKGIHVIRKILRSIETPD